MMVRGKQQALFWLYMLAEMEQVQFDAFCIQSVPTEYWDYRGVAVTDRVLCCDSDL